MLLFQINQGMQDEGLYYLLTLRLVPGIPFFLINFSMGLTQISTLKFFLVSLVGMLPGTALFVNAGSQLSRIDSLSGILSSTVIISFVLIGLLPLLAKKFLAKKKRKVKS